jgi:hypothetical protein
MRTLTPDQATLILTATGLPSLNAEHPVTKRVIAALPAEKADYRPDNIVRSAIDLAWHIVASETRFLEAVASGAFDFSGAARPAAIRTPADVVDWYSERFAKDIDRLKQMTGDPVDQDHRFPRALSIPRRGVRPAWAEPCHPSPRTALDVSPADGHEGAVDLRGELRRARSAGKSAGSVRLEPERLDREGHPRRPGPENFTLSRSPTVR